ncbi:MAG: hypothetical protein ACJATN_002886 [Neolewinella sp.]|jgi:hypothetical protein
MIWPNNNIMISPSKALKFNAVLFTVLFASFLGAQTVTKVFDQSYAKVDEVSLKQSRGPVVISPSTDGKIRVVTEMSVEARSKEGADAFLAKMGTKVQEMSNRLTVKTGMASIKNWSQNNNSIKVVFLDGTKFNGIRNFETSSTLYLPETQLLKLETKFERVQIDPEVKLNNLDLKLHNAKLRGGSISGGLELDVRFGEVELNDIGGSLTGTFHNTRGEFGDVGDVRLESRFSKLKMGVLKSLDMDSHNGRLEAKSITGSVEIDDRFGTYILGSTGNARVNTHNGTFEIESGGEYKIEGRFGNFDFDRIDDLIIRDNHNCDYDIKKLGSVKGNGRFTNFSVEHLRQQAELDLNNGYFRVEEVSPKFRGIEVEGAFFEVKLDFREPANYRVLADFRFGNVRLPDNLIVVKEIKDYSKLEMELNTPNASADSPLIRVSGQNGKLYID